VEFVVYIASLPRSFHEVESGVEEGRHLERYSDMRGSEDCWCGKRRR